MELALRQTTALSPFLPGTNIQYAWDSTSLEDWKRCARRYYYKMILNYRRKDESIHLRFGREYHQALHDYEVAKTNGADHDEAVIRTVQKLASRIGDFNPSEEKDGRAGKYKNR